MNQELRLAAAFAIQIIIGIKPVTGIHQRPVHFVQLGRIIVEFRESHDPVAIGEHVFQSSRLDRLHC